MNFLGIYRRWRHLSGRLFTELCAPSFQAFGRGSRLRFPLRLKGAERIAVGKNVFVGSDSWFEVVDGGERAERMIEIGDGTQIAGACTITSAASVKIGENVLIARYVYISDHSHEVRDPVVPIMAQGIRKVAPVVIRDGAWLGQGAVICPGVVVGRNSVVGANSVVIEDVPDRCVAAGVPARIIRRLDGEAAAS